MVSMAGAPLVGRKLLRATCSRSIGALFFTSKSLHTNSENVVDFVIAGGGMVGAAMACSLGWFVLPQFASLDSLFCSLIKLNVGVYFQLFLIFTSLSVNMRIQRGGMVGPSSQHSFGRSGPVNPLYIQKNSLLSIEKKMRCHKPRLQALELTLFS